MARPYNKSVDIKLVKKIDKNLMCSKKPKEIGYIINILNSKHAISKTADYYLGILSDDFINNVSKEEAYKYFNHGKGHLFCDYMLLKDQYEKQKLSFSISRLFQESSKIAKELKALSTKLPEASYLYFDLLINNMSGEMKFNKCLVYLMKAVKKNHRVAMFTLAELYLHDPHFNNRSYKRKAVKLLSSPVLAQYRPAVILLNECYKNRIGTKLRLDKVVEVDPVSKDDKLVERISNLTQEQINTNIQKVTEDSYIDKTPEVAVVEPENIVMNSESYYELFNIYYDDKLAADREEKLVKYAYLAYPKFPNDSRLFKYVYQVKKKSSNSYKDALDFLKNLDNIDPLFTNLERYDIYKKLKEDNLAYKALTAASLYVTKDNYSSFVKLLKEYKDKADYSNILINLHEKASKNASGEASLEAGKYYAREGKSQNLDKAIEYLTQASIYGLHVADYLLGIIYIKKNDSHHGLEWFQKGASFDEPLCSKALGDFYYRGQYVVQDYQEAVRCYRNAAMKNNAEAYYMLGNMLYFGIGFNKDVEKAYALFDKAEKLGSNSMNLIYGKIKILDKKDATGISLLEKSVVNDKNYEAADLLGDVYFNGQLVKKNYKKAYNYYKIAAEHKVGNSIYHLGLFNKEGYIFSKNIKKAASLFEEASMLGVKGASYEAGLSLYLTKKYEEAERYLLNSLSDDKPEAYYLLYTMYKKKKIKNISQEDIKYYKETYTKLNYTPRKKLS